MNHLESEKKKLQDQLEALILSKMPLVLQATSDQSMVPVSLQFCIVLK